MTGRSALLRRIDSLERRIERRTIEIGARAAGFAVLTVDDPAIVANPEAKAAWVGEQLASHGLGPATPVVLLPAKCGSSMEWVERFAPNAAAGSPQPRSRAGTRT